MDADLVERLVADVARLRGVTPDVVRVTYGIAPVHELYPCARGCCTHPSLLAAAEAHDSAGRTLT